MTNNDRHITLRSPGQRHGAITRLMSPGDVGQLTKPFVFIDYVDAPGGAGPKFGFHPHSGIATLTFPITFDIEHVASSGQVDMVHRGGVEWVIAGGGVWHRARPLSTEPMQGFQLWFALPPSHERGPAHTRFIRPGDVPRSGSVTVLLGSHGDAVSPLATPLDANCLWVELRDGEAWSYSPPPAHQVAWVFAQTGTLEVSGERLFRELAVFEEGNRSLNFRAVGDCAFLLGSATKHAYELVLGSHSVHTDAAALAAGTRRIAEIGEQLQRDGRLGPT
jgi:redox-sensitive bicupin YhaK (pirin superfamily)